MRNLVASTFSRNSPFAQNSKMMGIGFTDWIASRTGVTDESHPYFNYMVNDVGVFAVALNLTNLGNGWTEHTSLSLYQVEMAQGAFSMWKATGERRYYDLFMKAVTAYRLYFHANVPVPPFAQIWRTNYIINARDPFVQNGDPVARNQPYDPLTPGAGLGGGAIPDPDLMGNYPFADLVFAEVLSHAFQYTGERDFQAMFNSTIYTVFDFISNMRDGNGGVDLPYTPGAAPGTIGQTPRSWRKGSWSGMCYLAMQYPSTMAIAGRGDEMASVVNLYTDSQDAYQLAKGIEGPFYTGYAWDRPDNPLPANSWFNAGINNDNARSFANMAQLMLTLHQRNGVQVPEVERICTRHVEWLYSFVTANSNLPTFDGAMDPVPATAKTVYGPTAALYLLGLSLMAQAGYRTPQTDELMKYCFDLVSQMYYVGLEAPTSGVITPDRSITSRMYSAEHGGLVLHALGEFIAWETRADPAKVRPVGLARVLLENETGFVRVEPGDGVVLKEESQPEE